MYHHPHLSPQSALHHAASMIHDSYARFTTAEHSLYHDVDAPNLQHLPAVQAYVRACKDLIMCNLRWR
jgi:hypothetical protein